MLPIAVGIIQLATGCLLIGLPTAFDLPIYRASALWTTRLGMILVAGGICALLAYAARHRWSRTAAVVLGALGALPLLIAGGATLVQSGLGPTPLLGLLMGAALLADVASAPVPPDAGGRTVPWLVLTAAAAALGHGALALGAPATFALAASGRLAPILVPLGLAMLGAALVLGLAGLLPRFRTAAQVAASLPFVLLAVGLGLEARWPGTMAYGLLGVFLASEPWVRPMLEVRAAERLGQPRAAVDYEGATEAAIWGFVLLVAFTATIGPETARDLELAVLVAAASVFTIFWFHLRSVRTEGPQHTVLASGVYSALVVGVVALTGGMNSPFYFLYTLPIIALAWTRQPKAIVVPLVIPLAALAAESGYLAWAGGVPSGALLSVATPRAAGLLLVSWFSYMLARRNLSAQQHSRQARLQFQAILTSMVEGLITTDAAGRITLCNPAASALLDRTDDLVGLPLNDALPFRTADGGALPPARHPAHRALAGHRVTWERLLIPGPDGDRPVAVAAGPIGGLDHGPGAIVLLRDVRAEVEMERLRDDFFFIASHELRTPLTVMKGNLEIALEAAPEGTLRTTLDEALKSVGRLIRMVNDFLDAARLEHGTVSLRLEEAVLPDLVRQALEAMRPDADRKGLALAYTPPAGLPPVRADVERTLQILFNLIGNGVRYAVTGGIEITHAVAEGMVETLVRDTGPGIPPEHHGRLFSRFGQVERGLGRASGGSGLGLYIARKLAEQMGGTVLLKDSTPGQGSTFALLLPAARPPAGRRP